MPLHALRQVIDLKYYNHLKYCGTQYQITDVHLDNIEDYNLTYVISLL